MHKDTVSAVDLANREVRFAEMAPLTYDYLVLALGARVNFFGTKGAAEHAFPMYTLSDAVRLKEHILERWEAADKDPALVEDGALNVVVVGGGPTGVESAGALAELYHSNFAKDYPSLPQEQARLILVEAGPELFSMFKPDIRKYAKGALEKRGVEVLLGEMVASVAPTRVTLKSGTELQAHTLVWGAGLQGSPIAESLGLELERGNRVRVEPDLSLAGHPEVFVVGDVACDHRPGGRGRPAAAGLGRAPVRRACRREHRPARGGQGNRALRIPRQGHDGDDRPRGGSRAVPPRTDDEGQDGMARMGRRPSQAPADRRRQGQGGCGLDVGGAHA